MRKLAIAAVAALTLLTAAACQTPSGASPSATLDSVVSPSVDASPSGSAPAESMPTESASPSAS